LYAIRASLWAVPAREPAPVYIVPFTTPGPPVQGAGNPVHEVPGLTPKSPVIIVGPVLVTVEAPRTAKVCAEPNGGAVCAQAMVPILNRKIIEKTVFILLPSMIFCIR
jgi:hypothetical protein